MRRISANYIFTGNNKILKNGIVEVGDNGVIKNLIDTKGQLTESRNLEFYNGVIIPGFINTHCHLELSEHKNKIPKGLGLPNFLESVFKLKQDKNSDKTYSSIKLYDDLMKKNGIVAVGDICNTNKTIEIKKESTIYYHNFIEAIGLGDVEKIMTLNQDLYKTFIRNNLISSIIPHAPYSVSKSLLSLIAKKAENDESILSIHNQETSSENDLFKSKTGMLYKTLTNLGVDYSHWEVTQKNSVESIVDLLPIKNNILFVHNTYSSTKDVTCVNKRFINAYWCLCPLSNTYIENALPNFDLFYPMVDNVTLGTDSLASNTKLSILDEMKSIVKNFPKIEFEILLKWATLNGAKALNIDNQFGSIEKNKKPGLNLIGNFNFEKMQITETSQVKVLV